MIWEKVKVGSRVRSSRSGVVGKVVEMFDGGPGGDMEQSTGTWFSIEWPNGVVSQEHHLSFEDMGLGKRMELVEEEEGTKSKYADLALDVIKNIQNEIGRLSGGPASFYFERVKGYVNGLFNRFAPFKVGDRVKLVDDIPMTDDNPGWHHCAHFLKKGEMAVVKDVDYVDDYKGGRFVAECIFDNETYKDDEGNLHPTSKHLFSISEKWLEKVEE